MIGCADHRSVPPRSGRGATAHCGMNASEVETVTFRYSFRRE